MYDIEQVAAELAAKIKALPAEEAEYKIAQELEAAYRAGGLAGLAASDEDWTVGPANPDGTPMVIA